MSVRADSETLRALPIFRDCDPVALQVMVFSAERQEFAPGEAIITQGKKARAAFLILNGEAQLTDGKSEVGIAEPGSFLGEVAMLRTAAYSISAVAAVSVSTARFPHDLFMRVAREYPAFGHQVIRNLGDRLAGHVRELENIRQLLDKARNFSDL